MNRYEKGLKFENEAELFFISRMKEKGYRVALLKKRYRYAGGEIDLIFKVKNPASNLMDYHFLEVRGKMECAHTFDPLFSIRGPKLKRITRGVQRFLWVHHIKNAPIHIGLLIYQNKSWNYISDLFFF